MTSPDFSDFKSLRDRIQSAHAAGNHSEAQGLVDQGLLQFPHAPFLWVLKGIMAQFSAKPIDLEQPAKWFAMADQLSAGEHHPLLEAGNYQYAVLQDNTEALRSFRKLEEEAETLHLESLIGQVKCLRELDRKAEADELLQELETRFAERPEWRVLLEQPHSL